ncbi:hypothetical protein PUN28_005622 [Cardiocondyla obscurior]
MTSLILENADLNRLFPKCRPRGGPPPAPGATTQSSQQPHDSLCQTEAAAITTTVTAATAATAAVIASTNTSTSASAISDDMIDLERDTSDRYRKRANGRKKSGSLSRRTASVVPGFTVEGQLPHATKPLSSSSSSASGRSEDAPQYGSLPGSDHQGQSQQDDSGPEGSPVYILTSAKGGPSYKLRDSR